MDRQHLNHLHPDQQAAVKAMVEDAAQAGRCSTAHMWRRFLGMFSQTQELSHLSKDRLGKEVVDALLDLIRQPPHETQLEVAAKSTICADEMVSWDSLRCDRIWTNDAGQRVLKSRALVGFTQ